MYLVLNIFYTFKLEQICLPSEWSRLKGGSERCFYLLQDELEKEETHNLNIFTSISGKHH